MYIVTEHGPARQKISTQDGVTTDVFVIGLQEFLRKCYKGTHQALEALHSREKEVAPEYRAFFEGHRTYSPDIEETYDRTIRHLAVEESFKRRRYACRLAVNLLDMRMYGRFDPSLTNEQVQLVNELATYEDLPSAISRFLGTTRVKVVNNL